MNDVEIANFALGSLGVPRIQNLSDNNARARACSSKLKFSVEAILSMHEWNCAAVRKAMVPSAEPVYGWNHAYQLPADFLKLIEITPKSKHKIERRMLLSNESKLFINYIGKVEDYETLDPLLAETVAMKLASEIAEIITGKPSLKNEMMQKFIISLQEARGANSRDNTPERREESSFVNARRGNAGQKHRTFNSPELGYEVDNQAWLTK